MKFCLHFKRHISKIHNIIEKFEKSLKIRETLFTFQLHNVDYLSFSHDIFFTKN